MKRRRIILDNTFKLIRQNGMDNVSLQMIAEESGISKSLLQSYYPHKRKLTTDIMHNLFSILWDEIYKNVVDDEVNLFVQIKTFCYVIGSLGLMDEGLEKVIYQAFSDNTSLDTWSGMLNSWIEERNLMEKFSNEEITKLKSGISFIAAGGGRLYIRRQTHRLNPEKIADYMTSTLMGVFLDYSQKDIQKVIKEGHQTIMKADITSVHYAIDHMFDEGKEIYS
ncbi:transcriptional regulator [Lactobacillus psittaci DSM 15354]|uniref:Transcriptional regulator n=2 Tax=Lactobacillus psittaci TaxID=116089 RepID=A0A0R1S1A3_9LACO|nr:transcriptional regulator [Lactobacillus psittaci DSM 15354]